jgi:hypothetical protein
MPIASVSGKSGARSGSAPSAGNVVLPRPLSDNISTPLPQALSISDNGFLAVVGDELVAMLPPEQGLQCRIER